MAGDATVLPYREMYVYTDSYGAYHTDGNAPVEFYFADLDGHVWEVAYNPFIEIDEAGLLRLPD